MRLLEVIDNACSFFVSRSWSRSETNIFFDVDIVVKKKQIECGLALSVLLSTRSMRQPQWSKCCELTQSKT